MATEITVRLKLEVLLSGIAVNGRFWHFPTPCHRPLLAESHKPVSVFVTPIHIIQANGVSSIWPLFAIRYNLSSYLQSIDQGNNLASNKARAHFTLSGYHFNPDDITRLLGIEPTSVDASGARSALDKPVISSWELSTETMTDNIDVYKMTEIIIKKIEPAKEKILQVIKSHNLSPRIGVVLVLSIDKNESVPDVGFGARTIRFLADIGAFINVDYQLSERI